MCVTDLDQDLDIAEDEQPLPPGLHPMGGPHPMVGRYAGVAWGLAECPDGSDLGEAWAVPSS
jgi:hypothetical protein